MQPSHGELIDTAVIVKKPKDVGRLYTRSHFGTTRSGNILQLHLLEAVFLCGEQKLEVFSNGKISSFADLVKLATKHIPHFELVYTAYRDLRKRGHFLKLINQDLSIPFQIISEKATTPAIPVYVCSEQDVFDLNKLNELSTGNEPYPFWVCLVDEEGDLTYYSVDTVKPTGKVPSIQYAVTQALLLDNRTIIFDPIISKKLHSQEFFGKPFGQGLQLSLVETLYLIDIGVLKIYIPGETSPLSSKNIKQLFIKKQPDIIARLKVFKDLKNKGLLVKTGFKFGTHFRAYIHRPGQGHAEYLVHVVPADFCGSWADISRGIRLAHAVNKVFLFAALSNTHIEYLCLGRLRP